MAIVDEKPLSLEANSWQTTDIYQNYLKSLGQTEWSSGLKQVNIKPIAFKSMPNLGLDPITASVTETKQDIERTNNYFDNYKQDKNTEKSIEKIENGSAKFGGFLKEYFSRNSGKSNTNTTTGSPTTGSPTTGRPTTKNTSTEKPDKGAKLAQGANIAAGIVDSFGDSIGDFSEKKGWKVKSTTNREQLRDAAFSSVNSVMMKSGNPYLMAIGATNTLIDKTGGMSSATSRDKELSDSNNLSNATNTKNLIASFAAPGAGYFLKKTDKYNVSNELNNSSAYTGLAADNRAISNNFSEKKLLFGKNKAQKILSNAKNLDAKIRDTLDKNKELMTTSNAFDLQYQNTMQGGYDQANSTRIGKSGLKIDEIKILKNIQNKNNIKENIKKIKLSQENLETFKQNDFSRSGKMFINILEEIFPEINSFQKGGQINIIPGGALHAHKHNLIEVSDIYKNVTKKGIPVVIYEEGNTITQTAEVETSEVILHKELTDKLEELREINTKESQLQAGKLLATELIKNTINYSKEYRDILKTKKLSQNNEIHL